MSQNLGKVFISHTAADKPFVRSLADRIEANGFQVWLDERALIVGDPLTHSISRALAEARVVLVIVSASSISSRWLSYELNIATDRMIKGFCRVIPIVIDDANLPPEVRGLLYADCRGSIDSGWQSILTALQYESRQAAMNAAFWSRAEVLLKEVFGFVGSGSNHGEYKTRDCSLVYLPVEDIDGIEVSVIYETISTYSLEPIPLNQAWLTEFCDELDDWLESLALIVTERPINFQVDETHPMNQRVTVKRFRELSLGFPHRQIVTADLSGIDDEREQKAILRIARDMLIESAALEKKELQEVRAKNAAKISSQPSQQQPLNGSSKA